MCWCDTVPQTLTKIVGCHRFQYRVTVPQTLTKIVDSQKMTVSNHIHNLVHAETVYRQWWGVVSPELPTYTFWATLLWMYNVLKVVGKNKNKNVYNLSLQQLFTETWYTHANTYRKQFPSPSRLVMTFKTTALVWHSVPQLGSTTHNCSELCPIQTFVWQLVTSVCWSVQVSNVIGQFTPWNLIGRFPF